MKKKGFTLAEILGIIVIIGLLMILVAPGIINKIRDSKGDVEEAGNEIIYSSAQQYINENKKDYPAGKQYCISIQKLVADGKLVSPVVNIVTGENVENKYVLVQISTTGSMNFYMEEENECEEIADLPLIQFSISPTIKEKKWSKERSLTIIYPENGVEHQYAIMDDLNTPAANDWQTVDELTDNRVTLKITAPKYVNAKMKYADGKETKTRIFVGNIDTKEPEITSTCTATKATVNITDMPSGSKSGVRQYEVFEDDVQKEKQAYTTPKTDKITFNYTINQNKIYKVKAIDDAENESETILCLEKPVKVTFDGNGGTVSPTMKIYDAGKKYSETPGGAFPTPTRAGYTFAGWYTAASNGSKVEQSTTVSNSDHTLYAHWTAKKFTVTFNGNNCGTPSKTSMQVTYGGTYGTLATLPAKDGYVNDIWYTAASGGSKIASTTKVAITANQTLYAHCSKTVLYAKYDMNGGSLSSTHGSTVSTSGSLILINNKDTFKLGEYGGKIGKDGLANYNNSTYINIVRTGYTAKSGAEWKYSSKEFSQSTVYNVSDICDIKTQNCTATFKVNWKANTYKVQFNKNASDATGTMADESFTYGTEKALTSNAFKRTGYTFNGWNTKANGSGQKYTNAQKVKNLTSTNNGTVTLYAQWTLTCETYTENGKKVIGWKKIGSYWYYFDKNGCKVKGWLTDPNSTSCSTKKYYTNSSGQMQIGWKKIGDYWYYFDSSGCLLTGWIYDSNSTSCPSRYYYSNSSGQMQIGWVQVSSKWYYLAKGTSAESKWQTNTSTKPTGCMLTGWVYSTDYTCNSHGWYFNSSGALVKSTTIDNMYKVDSSGCWTHTWNSCVSGGYYQGGYVWSDTGGAWHDGWCEAGTKCAAGVFDETGCPSPYLYDGGKCCSWDSCATWHSGYYEGGNVWSDYATWIPCTGGWVAA